MPGNRTEGPPAPWSALITMSDKISYVKLNISLTGVGSSDSTSPVVRKSPRKNGPLGPVSSHFPLAVLIGASKQVLRDFRTPGPVLHAHTEQISADSKLTEAKGGWSRVAAVGVPRRPLADSTRDRQIRQPVVPASSRRSLFRVCSTLTFGMES